MGKSSNQPSELFVKILEYSPQGIAFLAPDLTILYANQRYARWHHKSKEEIIGWQIRELYDQDAFDSCVDKFRDAVCGNSQEFELSFTQDRRTLTMRTCLVPHFVDGVVDGVFAYCDDQTENKNRLLATQDQFDFALKVHSVAFWQIDTANEDWLYAEHIERLLELPLGELGNSIDRFLDHVHPADRRLGIFGERSVKFEGDAYRVDFRCRVAGGGYRWFRLHCNGPAVEPVEGGPMTGVVTGTMADIDELKKVEFLAADRLEYRDSFLSMLSHELRNPVAGIQYAIDVFEHDWSQLWQLPPECKTSINIIKRQTSVITRLLNDLLNGSRASLDQIMFEEELICFPDLLREVLDAAASIYQKKDQGVRFACDSGAAMIKGDRVRLTQAFTNLIDNASKFSQHHSEIAVHCQQRGGEIVTRISDSGPGVVAADRHKIFELFFQQQQTLERKSGGLGVGLYLVKKIVDAHHGEVSVISPGKLGGADFEVRLPVHENNVIRETKPGYTKSNSLVLVEDNEDARLALSMALKARGFDVTVYRDGQDAIDHIPSLAPRTVLIDIGLPGKDGLMVIRELRQHLNLSETFFVALTGYGQKHEREMILSAGFDSHLVKPVDIADLCTVITSRSAE